MMAAMDPSLIEFSKMSIKTLLLKEGFSQRFIDEFVMGAMRVNYGQTTDIHGLVGSVSMAGVEPGLWDVVGGNQQVPQGLLHKSGANLIPAEVTTVWLVEESSPPVYQVDYLLTTSTDPGDFKSKEYDIVVMATPFYKGMTQIKFEDFQGPILPVDNDFHTTVATFLEGFPNASYFGCPSFADFPSTCLTNKPEIPFNIISKRKAVSGKTTETPVYRLFSNDELTKEQLQQILPDWSEMKMVNWKAYPEYASSANFPTFTLHEQIYHVNAIEIAASAMEMSVVAAKNVALLAYYRYTGQYDKIDEVMTKSEGLDKTEL